MHGTRATYYVLAVAVLAVAIIIALMWPDSIHYTPTRVLSLGGDQIDHHTGLRWGIVGIGAVIAIALAVIASGQERSRH